VHHHIVQSILPPQDREKVDFQQVPPHAGRPLRNVKYAFTRQLPLERLQVLVINAIVIGVPALNLRV
jgi:hypothetical protein